MEAVRSGLGNVGTESKACRWEKSNPGTIEVELLQMGSSRSSTSLQNLYLHDTASNTFRLHVDAWATRDIKSAQNKDTLFCSATVDWFRSRYFQVARAIADEIALPFIKFHAV